MIVRETTPDPVPPPRQFTLTLTEKELRIIARSVGNCPSSEVVGGDIDARDPDDLWYALRSFC